MNSNLLASATETSI